MAEIGRETRWTELERFEQHHGVVMKCFSLFALVAVFAFSTEPGWSQNELPLRKLLFFDLWKTRCLEQR